MDHLMPALGGRKPLNILDTHEGGNTIVTLLSAMQSGVYHWSAYMPIGAESKQVCFNLSEPAITWATEKLAEAYVFEEDMFMFSANFIDAEVRTFPESIAKY